MRISVTEIENYSCSFEEMSTSNKGSKTTRDKGSPKCVFSVFSKTKDFDKPTDEKVGKAMRNRDFWEHSIVEKQVGKKCKKLVSKTEFQETKVKMKSKLQTIGHKESFQRMGVVKQ